MLEFVYLIPLPPLSMYVVRLQTLAMKHKEGCLVTANKAINLINHRIRKYLAPTLCGNDN